jgi:hypothetical protein
MKATSTAAAEQNSIAATSMEYISVGSLGSKFVYPGFRAAESIQAAHWV